MDIVAVTLAVIKKNGTVIHVHHSFWKPKDFHYCMSVHTIDMMLDDVQMSLDDVQIQDDATYNVYDKTLYITAKVIR